MKKNILALIGVIGISLLLTACGDGIFTIQSSGKEALVDQVEVIVAESAPPQYFAVVTGQLPDSCTKLGRTTQRVVGKTIKVTINTRRPEDAVCATRVQPFTERIRLDVDGLAAGQYAVEVNGVTTIFNLTEDH